MTKPMNVIYMHSHDTGRYVSPYGHALRTPNIQRFAEQGALFRQAFCANPTCSPSRCALLTGRSAHSCGMLGLAHRGFAMPDYSIHLANVLREAGYETALAGTQHEAQPDRVKSGETGYERVLGPDMHGSAGSAEAAVQFIKENHDRPFFLANGYGATHRPFPKTPDPLDDPRYTMPPAPLPDNQQTRYDMATYATLVNQLDTAMGKVIDAVDQAGIADNTLIILTTDHGIAFPGMKCHLTDHGIGIMLMMRGPDHTGAIGGKCFDQMVSQIDVMPTVLDWLGIDGPDGIEGTSLVDLLAGKTDTHRDEIFAEVNFHAACEPKRAVRTGRYKYIRHYDDKHDTSTPANIDASVSKGMWIEAGWRDRKVPRERLYDLMFDPNEACNIADDPAAADVLNDMRGRLDRWMRETNDPLLDGPLPMLEGYKITPYESLKPGDNIVTYGPGGKPIDE